MPTPATRSVLQRALFKSLLRRKDPFFPSDPPWNSTPTLLRNIALRRQARRAARGRSDERVKRELKAIESTRQHPAEKTKKTDLPLSLLQRLNEIAFPNLLPSTVNLISVHGGYKIQAGLIVHRVPLHLEEPEWKQEFRKMKSQWKHATENEVQLNPSLIFMKLPHHRYISPEDKVLKLKKAGMTEQLTQARTELLPEIERLLLEDGLHPAYDGAQMKNTDKSRMGQRTASNRMHSGRRQRLLDRDASNVYRAPWDLLTLLVWYPTTPKNDDDGRVKRKCGQWSLPIADRTHAVSMNETLLNICHSQLGPGFSPYIPNFCPISEQKQHFTEEIFCDHGLRGKQIFFYRAYWVPNQGRVEVQQSGLVQRFAWVRSHELSNYLSQNQMSVLRSCSLLN